MRSWCLLALSALLLGACGGGGEDDVTSCGPNGECPVRFLCEPKSNKCISDGVLYLDAGSPDAPPVAPETTISAAPPARTKDTSVTFTFSGTPSGVTFVCALDGAAEAPCTSPATITVAAGPHTMSITAVSGAARDATPATSTFTVDTTAPVATIATGPTTASGASATFTYASESGATFQCALAPAELASCPAEGKTFTGLVNGTSYTFQVRAVDDVGNVGETVTRVFTADTIGPGVTITSPEEGASAGTMVTATFAANPAESGVTFECDTGTGFAACASGAIFNLVDGSYTLTVRGKDAVGNVGASASVSFSVNTTVPLIHITSPPKRSTTGASVKILYTATLAETFSCTIDDKPIACDAGGASLGPLMDGTHLFSVIARSSTGTESAPDTITFTSDGTPPTMTVALATAEENSGLATFDVTSSETLKTVEATVAGAACTADVAIKLISCPYLPPGDHELVVTGIDAGGNRSATQTLPVSMTYGPAEGHLVVIGHGYRTVSDGPTRVLGNAVALAPAANLAGFKRPLRVSFFNKGMVDTTEKTNVRAALTTGLAQHGLTYDTAVADWSATADLAAKLKDMDVLVIYNQGLASLNDEAAAWKDTLTTFLMSGGVVVITEGWTGTTSKLPSRTIRVLDASLLGATVESVGGVDVAVNLNIGTGALDPDPVADKVTPFYKVPAEDPMILLESQDRFLTRVLYNCIAAPCTKVSTVHKVFGTPTRGPIEISVRDVRGVRMNGSVVVHDATGMFLGKTAMIGADGTVQRSVNVGDMVTVAIINPSNGLRLLETVVGVQPFDTLHLGKNAVDDDMISGTGTVTITLPDHLLYRDALEQPAVRYRAAAICRMGLAPSEIGVGDSSECGPLWDSQDTCSTPLDEGSWHVPYTSDCLFGGTLAVGLWAEDENGDTLSYQLVRDVDPANGATAGSWENAPGRDFNVSLRGDEDWPDDAFAGSAFRVGPLYGITAGADYPGPVNPLGDSHKLITPNNADGALLLVLVTGQGWGSAHVSGNVSPTASGKAVGLGGLLDPIQFKVSLVATRLTISTTPVITAAVAASFFLKYQASGAEANWAFIYPPNTVVTVPVLPPDLESWRPVTGVTVSAGVAIASDLHADYDAWRNQYFFPNILPLDETRPYVVRMTGVGDNVHLYLPLLGR